MPRLLHLCRLLLYRRLLTLLLLLLLLLLLHILMTRIAQWSMSVQKLSLLKQEST
jgi:hypothetical protein